MNRSAVVSQVKESFSSLFARDRSEDINKPPARTNARPRLQAVRPPLGGDDFMARLRDIVAARSAPIQAGRINFIGLEQAKERLGDRWTRVAEQAHSIARAAIERHLLPGDIFLAQDDKYVIAFANLNAVEAQLRCRLIASIIERTLFGEGSNGDLSVATAVATIDGNVVLKELPSLDDMIAWQTVPPESPVIRKNPRPITACAGNDDGRILWRPVWAAQLGLIAIHNARLSGYWSGGAGDDDGWFGYDDRLRGGAVEILEQNIAKGRSLIVGLPVHFETMAARNKRQAYLQNLASSVSERGKSQLLMILEDVPSGVHSSRLQEISSALRGQARALAVRFPFETTDFGAAVTGGTNWVGTELPDHMGEAMLFGLLEQFGRAADRAGIANRYLGNVRSVSLATAALKAGFTHLSGPIVGDDSATPKSVVSFDLETLYTSSLSKCRRRL